MSSKFSKIEIKMKLSLYLKENRETYLTNCKVIS